MHLLNRTTTKRLNRRLHTKRGTTTWTTTFVPFGVLLAPTETWQSISYGLLSLQEAAKRVLGVSIEFAGQNTDAASSAFKVAEIWQMPISTLCFPYIIRCVHSGTLCDTIHSAILELNPF